MSDHTEQHSEPPWNEQKMSDRLARRFHETYERLAPKFGYRTRKDTQEFDPDSPNGKLMIAVCDEIESDLAAEQIERLEREIKVLRSQVGILKKHLANFDHFYPDGFQENDNE